MFRTCKALLPLFVILGGSRACAQTLNLAGAQVSTPTYAQRQAFAPPTSSVTGLPMPAPALVGCNPYEDNNGPLLKGDPMLDGSLIGEAEYGIGPLSPGWFASHDAYVVVPHVRERMFAFVGPYLGTTPPASGFHLNNADLDWTGSPLVRLGYRLDQAAGEFMLAYQYVASTGSQLGADASGNPADVSSHFSLHVFDLEYGCRQFSLGPWCDMKWLMGVRIANAFFDTQSSSILGPQSLSNNFTGAGLLLGLNLSKTLQGTGMDIFCRLECGILYGPATQYYNAGGASLQEQHNNLVLVPKVEAGVGWRPTWNERLHFATGYTFQYWSNVAENSPLGIGVMPNSRGDFTIQGGFLRAEWNY